MRYFVIGDEDTVLGFRFTGISGRVVNDALEASAALREAAESRDTGVVIITQEVAEMIRQEVDAFRLGRELPLLVEVPGPGGPMPGRRTLIELIRAAIGVHV